MKKNIEGLTKLIAKLLDSNTEESIVLAAYIWEREDVITCSQIQGKFLYMRHLLTKHQEVFEISAQIKLGIEGYWIFYRGQAGILVRKENALQIFTSWKG